MKTRARKSRRDLHSTRNKVIGETVRKCSFGKVMQNIEPRNLSKSTPRKTSKPPSKYKSRKSMSETNINIQMISPQHKSCLTLESTRKSFELKDNGEDLISENEEPNFKIVDDEISFNLNSSRKFPKEFTANMSQDRTSLRKGNTRKTRTNLSKKFGDQGEEKLPMQASGQKRKRTLSPFINNEINPSKKLKTSKTTKDCHQHEKQLLLKAINKNKDTQIDSDAMNQHGKRSSMVRNSSLKTLGISLSRVGDSDNIRLRKRPNSSAKSVSQKIDRQVKSWPTSQEASVTKTPVPDMTTSPAKKLTKTNKSSGAALPQTKKSSSKARNSTRENSLSALHKLAKMTSPVEKSLNNSAVHFEFNNSASHLRVMNSSKRQNSKSQIIDSQILKASPQVLVVSKRCAIMKARFPIKKSNNKSSLMSESQKSDTKSGSIKNKYEHNNKKLESMQETIKKKIFPTKPIQTQSVTVREVSRNPLKTTKSYGRVVGKTQLVKKTENLPLVESKARAGKKQTENFGEKNNRVLRSERDMTLSEPVTSKKVNNRSSARRSLFTAQAALTSKDNVGKTKHRPTQDTTQKRYFGYRTFPIIITSNQATNTSVSKPLLDRHIHHQEKILTTPRKSKRLISSPPPVLSKGENTSFDNLSKPNKLMRPGVLHNDSIVIPLPSRMNKLKGKDVNVAASKSLDKNLGKFQALKLVTISSENGKKVSPLFVPPKTRRNRVRKITKRSNRTLRSTSNKRKIIISSPLKLIDKKQHSPSLKTDQIAASASKKNGDKSKKSKVGIEIKVVKQRPGRPTTSVIHEQLDKHSNKLTKSSQERATQTSFEIFTPSPTGVSTPQQRRKSTQTDTIISNITGSADQTNLFNITVSPALTHESSQVTTRSKEVIPKRKTMSRALINAKTHKKRGLDSATNRNSHVFKSKEGLPISKERLSRSKERLSISKERLPKSKEGLPISKERLSRSKERLSISKERLSKSKERLPNSKEKFPKSKERLSISKERLSRSKERLSIPKERLSTSKERLSRSKERLSRSKERLSIPKERLSISKERLSRSKERLSIPKERLPKSNERLPNSKEKFPKSKERLSIPKERFTNSKERLSKSKERLYSSKERLSRSKESLSRSIKKSHFQKSASCHDITSPSLLNRKDTLQVAQTLSQSLNEFEFSFNETNSPCTQKGNNLVQETNESKRLDPILTQKQKKSNDVQDPIPSPKEKLTSPKEKLTSPKEKLTSPKEKLTSHSKSTKCQTSEAKKKMASEKNLSISRGNIFKKVTDNVECKRASSANVNKTLIENLDNHAQSKKSSGITNKLNLRSVVDVEKTDTQKQNSINLNSAKRKITIQRKGNSSNQNSLKQKTRVRRQINYSSVKLIFSDKKSWPHNTLGKLSTVLKPKTKQTHKIRPKTHETVGRKPLTRSEELPLKRRCIQSIVQKPNTSSIAKKKQNIDATKRNMSFTTKQRQPIAVVNKTTSNALANKTTIRAPANKSTIRALANKTTIRALTNKTTSKALVNEQAYKKKKSRSLRKSAPNLTSLGLHSLNDSIKPMPTSSASIKVHGQKLANQTTPAFKFKSSKTSTHKINEFGQIINNISLQVNDKESKTPKKHKIIKTPRNSTIKKNNMNAAITVTSSFKDIEKNSAPRRSEAGVRISQTSIVPVSKGNSSLLKNRSKTDNKVSTEKTLTRRRTNKKLATISQAKTRRQRNQQKTSPETIFVPSSSITRESEELVPDMRQRKDKPNNFKKGQQTQPAIDVRDKDLQHLQNKLKSQILTKVKTSKHNPQLSYEHPTELTRQHLSQKKSKLRNVKVKTALPSLVVTESSPTNNFDLDVNYDHLLSSYFVQHENPNFPTHADEHNSSEVESLNASKTFESDYGRRMLRILCREEVLKSPFKHQSNKSEEEFTWDTSLYDTSHDHKSNKSEAEFTWDTSLYDTSHDHQSDKSEDELTWDTSLYDTSHDHQSNKSEDDLTWDTSLYDTSHDERNGGWHRDDVLKFINQEESDEDEFPNFQIEEGSDSFQNDVELFENHSIITDASYEKDIEDFEGLIPIDHASQSQHCVVS